ncbi:MAG: GNAT family N-acetyltransferase [Chryseolinea sp.]
MTTIEDATFNDVHAIRQIAEQTWWPSYGDILPAGQIRYMLDTLYNEETLVNLIATGDQQFVILRNNLGAQGFVSFAARPENPAIYKIHKLYVLPARQGNGFGSMLLNDVKRRLLNFGVNTMELNVACKNTAACSFYQKVGFHIIREEEIPMGPYLLKDYVMQLTF